MAIHEEIRQRYPHLGPASQKIARYLLENPNSVVTTSMRSLGSRAGSTPATLVRFAQQFGFAGWPQLKESFAIELGLGPEAYGERARTLVGRAGDPQTLLGDLISAQQHNLERSQRQNHSALVRVCDLVEKAPTVHAAGYRACYPVAFSFVYFYRLFRNSVQLLDGPGGTLEMQQRVIAHGDVVLLFGFAPYSRELLKVAQAARDVGCGVVAVADSAAAPFALQADETLQFSTDSPSFFPSVTGALALTEALLTLLASRAGDSVIGQIDRAETQLYESGAYLVQPKGRQRRA